MKTKFNAKRLAYLASMLSKYAHRWGECPSQRMLAWIDEYEDMRTEHYAEYVAFCAERGWSPDSNAYDCLA